MQRVLKNWKVVLLILGAFLLGAIWATDGKNDSSSSSVAAPETTVEQSVQSAPNVQAEVIEPQVATPTPTFTPTPTPSPLPTPTPTKTVYAPAPTQETGSGFSCSYQKNCDQMVSCEEAYYHLNVCGFRKRDGDNDGVPCESICN